MQRNSGRQGSRGRALEVQGLRFWVLVGLSIGNFSIGVSITIVEVSAVTTAGS